jgi:hypothetical protein
MDRDKDPGYQMFERAAQWPIPAGFITNARGTTIFFNG